MGYLDDIQTITRTVSNSRDWLDKSFNKSIAKGALSGTLQFPCLMSDSIPIDMAATIARTFERVYAAFVQTYLSMNSTVDISVDKNPSAFLRRFHKNITVESTDIDYYRENCMETDEECDTLMERIYDGTTKAYINESMDQMILFNFTDEFNKEVFESNKELLEESLAAYDFSPFPKIGNSPFYTTEAIDLEELQQQALSQDIKGAIDDKYLRAQALLKNQDNRNPFAEIINADIKKSNDMQPYQMKIRLTAINDKNEFVQFMDFIIGIKVVLHLIKSDEMIVNIQHAIQNNGKLFNFIRWTTGEKSLIKDLLLNINNMKLDVANRSAGASPWWLTLKRMKDTNSAQRAFLSRTQVVPNSTMVISRDDVDVLSKNYGFDLKNKIFALKLMKSLFLMNFVIVDEGMRTVSVLVYAFETLERELTVSSNKIGRELTRMISR